jgi:hypothetical protein
MWDKIYTHFHGIVEDAVDALLRRDRRYGWYLMPTPNGVAHFFHKDHPQPREPDAVCFKWLFDQVAVPDISVEMEVADPHQQP